MEPGRELIILEAAIVLQKLLGPSADYLGGEMKSYIEKGFNNLTIIFKAAIKKLGLKIEKDGQVPPKILKKILDEGYFCEDELASEYFGGVLASSRTKISRDDRAISYLHTISRLSSYQLRAHYIFYFLFKKLYPGFGEINWQKFVGALYDVGYKGDIVIEHEDFVFSGDRMDEGLRLGLKHLKLFVLRK